MLSKLSLWWRHSDDKSIEGLRSKLEVIWYVAHCEGAPSPLHDPDIPAWKERMLMAEDGRELGEFAETEEARSRGTTG